MIDLNDFFFAISALIQCCVGCVGSEIENMVGVSFVGEGEPKHRRALDYWRESITSGENKISRRRVYTISLQIVPFALFSSCT